MGVTKQEVEASLTSKMNPVHLVSLISLPFGESISVLYILVETISICYAIAGTRVKEP